MLGLKRKPRIHALILETCQQATLIIKSIGVDSDTGESYSPPHSSRGHINGHCRDISGESGMGKYITDQEPPLSKWERIKYFLVITAVVLSLVLLLLMMFEGAVFNFQCSLYDFLSFECMLIFGLKLLVNKDFYFLHQEFLLSHHSYRHLNS